MTISPEAAKFHTPDVLERPPADAAGKSLNKVRAGRDGHSALARPAGKPPE